MVSAEKCIALKLSTIDRQNISLISHISTYIYDNFYLDIYCFFLSLKINRLNHVFVFEAYKDQFPTLIREIELSPTCKDKIGPLEIDRQH